MTQYVEGTFNEKYISTIGVDFMLKKVTLDDLVVKLQIWDTAGQERFRTISETIYACANVCVLVFDVNDAKSFDHLDSWYERFINCVKPSDPSQFPFILVGTKADKVGKREVPAERIEKWCEIKGGIRYFETSARAAHSSAEKAIPIKDAFMAVAEHAFQLQINDNEAVESALVKRSVDSKSGCVIC